MKTGARPARSDAGGLAPSDLPLFADSPGLVMDAKFRTRWRAGELERALESLITQKRYDCEGDRVFVLHPVPGAVSVPTSPLDWGAHCGFGHDPERDHRRGTVWLAPDAGHGDAQRHLRRLIGLALQASFSQPLKVRQSESESVMLDIENDPRVRTTISVTPSSAWDALLDGGPPEEQSIWLSPSFCLSCGSAHAADGVKAKLTRGNRTYWQLACRTCEMVTTRTHCYGENCATTLFKNHLGTTYHRTIANQPTNVMCPVAENISTKIGVVKPSFTRIDSAMGGSGTRSRRLDATVRIRAHSLRQPARGRHAERPGAT